jgi:hypothetical protein
MAVTAAVVLSGGSEGDEEGRRGAAEAPGTPFRARALRIRGIRPEGWRLRRTRRAVRLTAPGRSALVAVSATPFPVGGPALLRSTLDAIRRSYRRVRMFRRGSGRLGGLPARTANAAATNARRARVDLIVAAARGRRRSYLLQVIVARGAPADLVIEAQSIVNSLRLSG